MASATLGRYVPGKSAIHKLDPRNKIACLILLMVAIFFNFSNYVMTFVVGGILAIFIFMLLIASSISIKDIFKSLRVLWFFIVLLLIINIFIPPANATKVAFSLGKVNIYLEAILQSLKIILRLILMIELTMILTATTKPLELTYALEWYLTPLKLIKFPAHEVAMTISIALRFIPTLLEETDRIMKAQSSRGVDFKHGKISSRLKAIVSLIIPLFISSFQRSEELADSMEARGYDPKAKRTKYRVLRFSIIDIFSFVLSSAILAIIITFSVTKFELVGLTNFIFVGAFVVGIFFIFALIDLLALRIKK